MAPTLHLFCILTHTQILFPLNFDFRAKYYKDLTSHVFRLNWEEQ